MCSSTDWEYDEAIHGEESRCMPRQVRHPYLFCERFLEKRGELTRRFSQGGDLPPAPRGETDGVVRGGGGRAESGGGEGNEGNGVGVEVVSSTHPFLPPSFLVLPPSLNPPLLPECSSTPRLPP